MGYILVTGSNGFIGSRLIEGLLEQGYKVIGVSTGEKSNIKKQNFKYIRADLTDYASVNRIFSKYEISHVIHLAALAHFKHLQKISWNNFYRVNTLASKTIFQCAKKTKAKVFFSSTVDVYGETKDNPITEESKPLPLSDYAKSKYLAELTLKEEFREVPSNYVIARFAPVYARGFMKDIYKRIYIKYPNFAFIIGQGLHYHFVSVHNVTDFILYWLGNSTKISGIFNVCDSSPIHSKEFIRFEKEKGRSRRVFHIPNIFTPIITIVNQLSRLITNKSLERIRINLGKLIDPHLYSTEKMYRYTKPKWDLKRTVYKEEPSLKIK